MPCVHEFVGGGGRCGSSRGWQRRDLHVDKCWCSWCLHRSAWCCSWVVNPQTWQHPRAASPRMSAACMSRLSLKERSCHRSAESITPKYERRRIMKCIRRVVETLTILLSLSEIRTTDEK